MKNRRLSFADKPGRSRTSPSVSCTNKRFAKNSKRISALLVTDARFSLSAFLSLIISFTFLSNYSSVRDDRLQTLRCRILLRQSGYQTITFILFLYFQDNERSKKARKVPCEGWFADNRSIRNERTKYLYLKRGASFDSSCLSFSLSFADSVEKLVINNIRYLADLGISSNSSKVRERHLFFFTITINFTLPTPFSFDSFAIDSRCSPKR